MLHPQEMLSKEIRTFEVGIALLICASSSVDNGVESAYWIEHACMRRPYYITLWRAHGLDSKFTKSFQQNLQKPPFVKIWTLKNSAIGLPQTGSCNSLISG